MIQVGVIGCGVRMQVLLKMLVAYDQQVRVMTLVDPDGGAVETARGIIGKQAVRFADAQAMLTNADVDWVMIASPNCAHREHIVAALDAGKHVYCEKPLTTTIEDCVAIHQAVQRNNGQVVIGFTLRFSPHYRAIRRLIEEGVIGNLISMEFNETLNFNHGGYIHQDWRRHRHIAGTYLLEKCCHDIDLANWYVGSRVSRAASFGGLRLFTAANQHLQQTIGPDPVSGVPAYQGHRIALTSPFRDDKDIVDHQVAILEYENDVRATFHTHCASAIPERRMVLIGDRGAIRADVMVGKIEYQRIGWGEKLQTCDVNIADGHGGGDGVLVRELVDVMHGRGKSLATFEAGLESAIACFAIDQALDTGTVIHAQSLWQQINTAT